MDEVGYLSYDSRYAALLFEVITRRYQQRATVLTTNKPFGEWNQVFPNAACVVTLVARLVHRAEIINIAGPSSDDSAANLIEFLHALTEALKRHYAGELLRREHQRFTQSPPPHPSDPVSDDGPPF